MDAGWLWLIATLVAVSLAAAIGAWAVVRSQDDDARALAGRVGRLPWRGKARLAWELLGDPRVPLWLRATIPALVLYLLLPLDVIPDFIPVLGHLDDLLVVALGVGLLVRFTPRDVVEERLAALERTSGAG